MKEEDEWLITASKALRNGLKGVGIENRQAAVKGTMHLEGWRAIDITRMILEMRSVQQSEGTKTFRE